jgi:hypothetical protein
MDDCEVIGQILGEKSNTYRKSMIKVSVENYSQPYLHQGLITPKYYPSKGRLLNNYPRNLTRFSKVTTFFANF